MCAARLLSLVPAGAFVQFHSAVILGSVKDTSGAVVPGTTVTLTSTATAVSQSRVTNDNGVYEFGNVRPGTYVISAEKEGFAMALVDKVEAQVGARQTASVARRHRHEPTRSGDRQPRDPRTAAERP